MNQIHWISSSLKNLHKKVWIVSFRPFRTLKGAILLRTIRFETDGFSSMEIHRTSLELPWKFIVDKIWQINFEFQKKIRKKATTPILNSNFRGIKNEFPFHCSECYLENGNVLEMRPKKRPTFRRWTCRKLLVLTFWSNPGVRCKIRLLVVKRARLFVEIKWSHLFAGQMRKGGLVIRRLVWRLE